MSYTKFNTNNNEKLLTSSNDEFRVLPDVKEDFDIVLYYNSSYNNEVNKNLTKYLTVKGVLREETDIINPSITFQIDSVPDFNYVYIEQFKRYYFVTGITSIVNQLWQVDLHIDLLMTYKDTIYNNVRGIILKVPYQTFNSTIRLFIPNNDDIIYPEYTTEVTEIDDSFFTQYMEEKFYYEPCYIVINAPNLDSGSVS